MALNSSGVRLFSRGGNHNAAGFPIIATEAFNSTKINWRLFGVFLVFIHLFCEDAMLRIIDYLRPLAVWGYFCCPVLF